LLFAVLTHAVRERRCAAAFISRQRHFGSLRYCRGSAQYNCNKVVDSKVG